MQVGVAVTLVVSDRVAVALAVSDRPVVELAVTTMTAVAEGLIVGVEEGCTVPLAVGVPVGDAEAIEVLEGVAVPLAVAGGVRVTVAVALDVGAVVTVLVRVADGVLVATIVGVLLGDEVGVDVAVPVAVADPVAVGEVAPGPTVIWPLLTVIGKDTPPLPLTTTVFKVSGETPFASAVTLNVASAPLPVAPMLVFPPRTATAPTDTVPAVLSTDHGGIWIVEPPFALAQLDSQVPAVTLFTLTTAGLKLAPNW
jgi:hypothetical protein